MGERKEPINVVCLLNVPILFLKVKRVGRRSQNEIHGIGRKDLHHLEVPLSTAQKSPLGCPENWTANRYILRDCYTMAWRNPVPVAQTWRSNRCLPATKRHARPGRSGD